MAILDLCEPSEMFWQTCRFTPTEAFEEVRPIFEAFSSSYDDVTLDAALQALEQLELVLIDIESGRETPDFLVSVHEDHAELRFA